ncbi:MAG: thrB [Jatrophihabitantaceae bacterium]|nr:thrB [Jatrophihabitantaceae bacterium]
MARSGTTAPSADAAVEVAARWFGLDTGSVRQVPGGATNEVYRVVAARGEHFLRRYRHADRQAVDREHRLIRHVAQSVPAPEALRLADGSTLVEAAGSVWAMFASAVGAQVASPDLTPAHTASAGATLARLHRGAADMPHAGFASWGLRWDGPDWQARLQRVLAAIDASPVDEETDAWAAQRVQAQIEWLGDPACSHRYSPAFPAQVIHGDFHEANLFFAGTEVSGVIDWDGARVMPRAFEIARSCYFLCQMQPELTFAFLDGYASVTRLDRGELEDGARAWGCFADHHVWAVEEAYLQGNHDAARFIWRRPFAPFTEEWRALGF